jgi:hypothetical protein
MNSQATYDWDLKLRSGERFVSVRLAWNCFSDNSVSARCCHLLQKEFDTVYGNVMTATMLEARIVAFSDL